MDKEQKRLELNALGVHDIRVLARNLGLARPTMRLKDDLVDELVEVLCGEKEIKIKNTQRGRKATPKLANQNSEFIIPAELQAVVSARLHAERMTQTNLDAVMLCQNIQDKMVLYNDKEGYVTSHDGHNYFLDIKAENLVFLKPDLIKACDLQIGDRVLARCAECPGINFSIAKEILLVNFQKPAKRKFNEFEDFVKDAKGFVCDGFEEGKSITLPETLTGDCLDTTMNRLARFQAEGFKVIALGTNVPYKLRAAILERLPCESALLTKDVNPLWNLERVNNFVNNCLVRATAGEKIVLLIVDLQQLMLDLDFCFNIDSPKFKGFCFDTHRFMGYVLALPRILKNGGSLTIIAANE